MKPYGNKSGISGISAYEYDDDSITIMFEDHSIYHYTYKSSGKVIIEIMKKIADNGIGLTTFINQHVRGSYAKKIA
jgi:hypothetical protein